MTEAGGGTREAGDGEGIEGVWEREAGRDRGRASAYLCPWSLLSLWSVCAFVPENHVSRDARKQTTRKVESRLDRDDRVEFNKLFRSMMESRNRSVLATQCWGMFAA